MMSPEQVQMMRLEMEKQALSAATVSRGVRAARGALRGSGGAVGRAVKSTGGAIGRAAKSTGRAVKEFGQRQVHGFTGGYKDSLTVGLKRRQGDLVKEIESASGDKLKKLTAKAGDVAKEIGHRDTAQAAGITSLPSLAKNVVMKPKATSKALWQHATGGSKKGVALTLALPGGIAAADMRKGDESETGGRSMGQKAVQHATTMGTSILTGGLSSVPGMVTAGALEGGSRKLTKTRKRTPVEHIGAAGQQAGMRAGQTLARRAAATPRDIQ